MFSLSSPCQDYLLLVGAHHTVKAVTLSSLTQGLCFSLLSQESFFPACWWRQKIPQIVFCVHFTFCHLLRGQNQLVCMCTGFDSIWMWSLPLCDRAWVATCWRIALRMWFYGSLLVYLMAICCIFSGQLNLTLEKQLCSVLVLSQVLYVVQQKQWLGCSALNFEIQDFSLSFL